MDGARPDTAAAKAAGLRYVHLPIGYDGVPEKVRSALKQLLGESADPIFIHCHHGKHRGPAAAAIAGLIAGSHETDQALAVLAQCGTSEDYIGLWRDVREFRGVRNDIEAAELVETAEIDPLPEQMVVIDAAYDQLAAKAEPSAATALLVQGFRESARLVALEPGFNQELVDLLSASARTATALGTAIKAGDEVSAKQLTIQLKRDCRSCHQTFRN